jgi:hypothetical protein
VELDRCRDFVGDSERRYVPQMRVQQNQLVRDIDSTAIGTEVMIWYTRRVARRGGAFFRYT